jgi:DNA replication protein
MAERRFAGFPAGKVRQARLPDVFFSELLPTIGDLAELKVTLHVLWRLQRERTDLPALSHAALASDRILLASLASLDETPLAALDRGLACAVERGTLLQVRVGDEANPTAWYLVNTPRGREAWAQAQRGELTLAGVPAGAPVWVEAEASTERANIFTLYEQNIGLLTPLIAEELREAEDTYPAHWIEDAFREAVRANKRNWRYVAAVLKRWACGGRGGIDRGDAEKDQEHYRGGKYGHLIQH